jgi:anti-sigma B factor antagonist
MTAVALTGTLGANVHSVFHVDVRSQGRAAIIAVSGELDLASSPSLEAELQRASGTDSELLVLDLRRLEFMDSTGLSVIVKAHQRLTDEGRDLCLVRGSQQVQRLLDLTGVAERIQLADTPEEILNGA